MDLKEESGPSWSRDGKDAGACLLLFSSVHWGPEENQAQGVNKLRTDHKSQLSANGKKKKKTILFSIGFKEGFLYLLINALLT